MNGFLNWMEQKFVPIAAKFGSQKHLVALRDAFAGTMPVMLAGATAVMLNNVFFNSTGLLGDYISAPAYFEFTEKYLAPIMVNIFNGTLAISSVIFLIGLAYHRANQEKLDVASNVTIVFSSMVVMGFASYFSVTGIILSMVFGLLFSELFFFITRRNWTIKMPDSVPPAVSKAFAAVIPGFICLLVAALINFAISFVPHPDGGVYTIFSWFEVNMQGIFDFLGSSVITVLLLSFLVPFFWFFGLHGHNMLNPVFESIYTKFSLENIDMYLNDGITTIKDGLHVWVRGSWDVYAQMGGSGSTLALLIAIFIVGKVKSEKEIAKLAAPMGVFQINEPVTFGIPMVLNPVYAIPFMFIPVIQTAIGYFATASGFAGPVVNSFAWTTPPIFSAFVATNGSWGATLTALICFVVAILLYIPFVLVSNKVNKEE